MAYQNIPKHTSEAVPDTDADLEAVLGRLTIDQIRFVLARSETATDKDAAMAVSISPNTAKNWSKETKRDVAVALRLMAEDGLQTALHIRRRNLAKAMGVKAAGLDSGDERLRQGVATEIIEWELGKATQRNQNEESGEVVIRVKRDSDRYNPARSASGPAEDPE